MSSKPVHLPLKFIVFVIIGTALALTAAFRILPNIDAIGVLKTSWLAEPVGSEHISSGNNSNRALQTHTQLQRAHQLRMFEQAGDWSAAVQAADNLCSPSDSNASCTALRIQVYEAASKALRDDVTYKDRLIQNLESAGLSNSECWEYGTYAGSAGRKDEEAAWLNRAVLISPKSAQDWYAKGLAHSRLNQWMDAIESLESAKLFGYAQRDVLYALGKAYEGKGELENASSAYLSAAGAISSEVVGRGDALFADGWLKVYQKSPPDDRGAIDAFKQSIAAGDFTRKQAGMAAAYFQLGHAYLRLGDYEHAVASYREASRLAPQSSDYRVSLGVALLRAGNDNEGLSSLNDAMKLNPENVPALLAMGDYYQATGDAVMAERVYSRVLSIDPNNEHAAKALQQLK